MTPAINLAKKKKIPHTIHQYDHDPSSESYGLEAVQRLGLDANTVFKTLLYSTDGKEKELAVAVIPVNCKLNLKFAAKAAGKKKAEMANPDIAQKITGYVVGGISPLGQKKRLPTFIHESALQYDTIHVSAGRRGVEIELSANDLASIAQASFYCLCD